MSETIRTSTVPEAIVQHLLDEISSGRLAPGAPLPSQRDLARRLGVSMASLREALRSLEALGIIEVRRGIGSFVTSSPLNPISKRFDWSVLLEADRVEKILEARNILEIGVAQAAARRATDEQIGEIAKTLGIMADAFRSRDVQAYEEADIRFHQLLAAATDNELLVRFAQTLLSALEQFIKAVPHTAPGLGYHFEILAALREHNPGRAETAMRHLLSISDMHFQKARAEEQSSPAAPHSSASST